jgi:hypothetical protein
MVFHRFFRVAFTRNWREIPGASCRGPCTQSLNPYFEKDSVGFYRIVNDNSNSPYVVGVVRHDTFEEMMKFDEKTARLDEITFYFQTTNNRSKVTDLLLGTIDNPRIPHNTNFIDGLYTAFFYSGLASTNFRFDPFLKETLITAAEWGTSIADFFIKENHTLDAFLYFATHAVGAAHTFNVFAKTLEPSVVGYSLLGAAMFEAPEENFWESLYRQRNAVEKYPRWMVPYAYVDDYPVFDSHRIIFSEFCQNIQ